MPPMINGQMGQGPGAVNPASFGNPSNNTMPSPYGTPGTPPLGALGMNAQQQPSMGGAGPGTVGTGDASMVQNPYGKNTGFGSFGIQNPQSSTFIPNQPPPSYSTPQGILQKPVGVGASLAGAQQMSAQHGGVPILNRAGQPITGGGQQFRSTSGSPFGQPGQQMQPGGQGGMAPQAQPPQQFDALAQNTSQSPGASPPPGMPGNPNATPGSPTSRSLAAGSFALTDMTPAQMTQMGNNAMQGAGGNTGQQDALNAMNSQQALGSNVANTSANPQQWWNQPQMQSQGQPWTQPQQSSGQANPSGLMARNVGGHLGALGQNAGQPNGGGQIGGYRQINGQMMATPGARR